MRALVALVLFLGACLNPMPDDFPQQADVPASDQDGLAPNVEGDDGDGSGRPATGMPGSTRGEPNEGPLPAPELEADAGVPDAGMAGGGVHAASAEDAAPAGSACEGHPDAGAAGVEVSGERLP